MVHLAGYSKASQACVHTILRHIIPPHYVVS